jgi:hypothetical protein
MSTARITLTTSGIGTARTLELLREIEAETGAAPSECTTGAAEHFTFEAESFEEAERMVDGIQGVFLEHGKAWQTLLVEAGERRRFYVETSRGSKGGEA